MADVKPAGFKKALETESLSIENILDIFFKQIMFKIWSFEKTWGKNSWIIKNGMCYSSKLGENEKSETLLLH